MILASILKFFNDHDILSRPSVDLINYSVIIRNLFYLQVSCVRMYILREQHRCSPADVLQQGQSAAASY